MTRQVCVARQDILRGRPTEHIVDEVSIADSEPRPLRIFASQIKLDTRCAVKKEAPRVSSLIWLAKILNGLGSESAMETSSTMCSVGRPLRMSWRATQT